jgi:uncharacterized protein involved in propanediol utilization
LRTAAAANTMTRRSGLGRVGAHHGEILQGAFPVDGTIVRGLVTLLCPRFEAAARVVLEPRRRDVNVEPGWKLKARRAARLTLDTLGLHAVGARIVIDDTIPICRGFGSSTGDIVATVKAICSAVGARLDDVQIAKLAVQSEHASDPLMFEHAVLFAHRDGMILEDFRVPLPALEVVGFPTSDHQTGVATLELIPARYSSRDVAEFQELARRLGTALARGNVEELGLVATASARLNQGNLPVPKFKDLTRVAGQVGAAGIQVAHSGDIAGIVFDANDPDLEPKLAEAQILLARLGITSTWRFRSP